MSRPGVYVLRPASHDGALLHGGKHDSRHRLVRVARIQLASCARRTCSWRPRWRSNPTRSQNRSRNSRAPARSSRSLLPKSIPQLRGMQVAGAWQPASAVSGDYYDVLALDDDRLAICIGDVVGKGITAALLMANLQAAFRAFATADASPAAVCSKLNAFMCGNVASGKFISFFYCIVDARDRSLAYENAGHCPAQLVRAVRRLGSRSAAMAPCSAFCRIGLTRTTGCSWRAVTASCSSPTASPRPKTSTATNSVRNEWCARCCKSGGRSAEDVAAQPDGSRDGILQRSVSRRCNRRRAGGAMNSVSPYRCLLASRLEARA